MRHRITIVFILLLLGCTAVVSQPCPPGGIIFYTQSQIDSFPILYPNCSELNGFLGIYGDDINNLNGLSALTSTDGSLSIWDNVVLADLSGLDNLSYVGGYIYIKNNSALVNIASLSNLSAINGYIAIEDNPSLISVDGLANINSNTIEYLVIAFNPSLSHCGMMSICDFLTNPTGRVRIAFNDFGCSTPSEVANNCGITLPCLPYGEYWLYKQIQIDSFAVNYPNCTELQGYVRIRDDVTNLYGLSGVQSIQELHVEYTDSLTSLLGLSNLEKIEFQFVIMDNESLIDLSGLYSLDSVGANVIVMDNPALTSLIGLDSLIYLDGNLSIRDNNNLEVLDGIDNIESESIHGLFITGNPKLSKCNVQSICDYLFSPPYGKIEIYDNLVGCNTRQEVEESCTVGVPELFEDVGISAYPNPFTTTTTIEFTLNGKSKIQISIFNTIGEMVYQQQETYNQGSHLVSWSPGPLPAGLYYGVLRSGEGVSVVKMVKQ